MDRTFVKNLILKHKLLDKKKLKNIECISVNSNEKLIDTILNGRYLSEDIIMPVISDELGLEWTKLDNLEQINTDLFHDLPAELKDNKDMAPLFERDGQVIIAMSDPLKLELLDTVAKKTKWKVKASIVTSKTLLQSRDYIEAAEKTELEDFSIENLSDKSIEDIAREAPVIKRVNRIMMQAISKGASDIHLEPYEKEAIVRYRVDGVLSDFATYPANLYPAIISRIKIMAELNIAERRMPQDGRIKLPVMDRIYDLRIATIPMLHGEGAVMRILDKSNAIGKLEKIGFSDHIMKSIKKCITNPFGIMLVTGPTGSGKTTTLHATLSSINNHDTKIITIEDPVEYEIPRITQIHVNSKVGLTFAVGLRSILRLDPDVVMVGEIRDLETAEIAIRTAMTGHLVFATLHTNDAPSSLTRLIDMGIEPFLITSSLRGVLAQRLIRKICPYCKIEVPPDEIDKTFFMEANIEIPKKLFKGKGCEECSKSGYIGRTCINEFLEINEEIRKIANSSGSSEQIRKAAQETGMKTMREDGIIKVINGETTVSEIIRVTQLD
jgi:type II secretory ATPase GspE/PulE/Tfp pilus assembly ATPase PilB-like protein